MAKYTFLVTLKLTQPGESRRCIIYATSEDEARTTAAAANPGWAVMSAFEVCQLLLAEVKREAGYRFIKATFETWRPPSAGATCMSALFMDAKGVWREQGAAISDMDLTITPVTHWVNRFISAIEKDIRS